MTFRRALFRGVEIEFLSRFLVRCGHGGLKLLHCVDAESAFIKALSRFAVPSGQNEAPPGSVPGGVLLDDPAEKPFRSVIILRGQTSEAPLDQRVDYRCFVGILRHRVVLSPLLAGETSLWHSEKDSLPPYNVSGEEKIVKT